MSDISPAVPYSKAAELAAACLQDDAEQFYYPFEFDHTRFPQLQPGEIIQVTYRRIRPPQHPVLVWDEAVTFEVAGLA